MLEKREKNVLNLLSSMFIKFRGQGQMDVNFQDMKKEIKQKVLCFSS